MPCSSVYAITDTFCNNGIILWQVAFTKIITSLFLASQLTDHGHAGTLPSLIVALLMIPTNLIQKYYQLRHAKVSTETDQHG
jgi:hypothetical protein|tara:strand:- start:1565 stop:1810 length:246 start_codon:yes stop_codon:yes gene_type:complete